MTVAVAAAVSISPQIVNAGCTEAMAKAGVCGSNNGTSVTITADRPASQNPGSSGRPSPNGPANPGASGPGAPVDAGPSEYDRCRADRGRPRVCREPRPDESRPAAAATPEAPSAPPIAITDLVNLAPATATPVGDPSNLGVAGLPANVMATASVHTRTGALFGMPVSARFTPVAFEFDYGDGAGAALATGGATWERLGQAPFTPTATSHVYRERGTYDMRVTVRYTAEIDVGTGWLPLDGQLAIPGPSQQIRIFEAHTALVRYTCGERPTAPGC